MKLPPKHLIAAAASTPSGAPPVPIATWMPVVSIAVAMHASTSPSEMSRMRAPAARTSSNQFRVARPVENHHADVVDRLLERVGDRFEVIAHRRVDVHVRRGLGTDREFLHIRIRRVQQAAAFGDRHHGDRVRKAVGDEIRAFDRIDGDVDLLAAAAELLADVQHRRFVAFAFADDDSAGDLHVAERLAHLFDRRAVGGVALAATHPARRGQRRAFGDLDEIERMDRMVEDRARGRACHLRCRLQGKRLISC